MTISATKTERAHSTTELLDLTRQFRSRRVGNSYIVCTDCFEWLRQMPANCLHAIVTDPPYGVKEYDADQLLKRSNGHGGIWRIPPSFDGHKRSPVPRFTALSGKERARLREFFGNWAALAVPALRPGAHVFLASNAFISQAVFSAVVEGGLEFRGEVIRLVATLRGGDRPKNAHEEFSEVCSMPRGNYEPWGVFRKPLPNGMTVSDCLRCFETGGLQRRPDGRPFRDVIPSQRTTRNEREIADHPSLKPQSFLRQLVHAALPLGKGVIADPFMGSGSTVAAAEAVGFTCVGVERSREYYRLSVKAIPRLARVSVSEPPELTNRKNMQQWAAV